MGQDEPTTDALVATALLDDHDAAWDAVSLLHRRGSRDVLDAAAHLAGSDSARERVRAADILGQLGVPRRAFPDACLSLLMGLLATADAHPEVIAAAATALGHLSPSLHKAQRAVVAAALAELHGHADADVRFGVVAGLSGLDEPQAIAALIVLSADSDGDVRNWATFAIGSLSNMDGASVRDALAARLGDPYEEVRGEAMVGLARRGDGRVHEVITKGLGNSPSVFAVRAAEALGDSVHVPALEALRGSPDEELATAVAAALETLAG